MKTTKINTKLSNEEKEVVLIYNSADKKWIMDTTVTQFANKARKQGWKQTKEYIYDDNTVCGGVFEAPKRAVTIRSVDKKQMSEKQMNNLFGGEEDDDEE